MSSAHLVVELWGGSIVSATLDGAALEVGWLPRRVGPALLALAAAHPGTTLAWHQREAAHLLTDPASWADRLTSENEVRSVGLLHGEDPWLATLGAADFESALQLPPPRDRAFGTWLVSPVAGVTSTSLLASVGAPPPEVPFAAWALALGHRAYRAGAFLWSDPQMLRPEQRSVRRSVHTPETIAAVVRHCFGRRFLLSWLTALGSARTAVGSLAAARVALRPDEQTVPAPLHWPDPRDLPVATALGDDPIVDVIIPTLGRRELLLGVLDDLATQTLLPRRVVVVEQTGGAPAGLRLRTEGRPFSLEHVVVRRLGAGNARNVALGRTDAPWVLMLDDDVRFDDGAIAQMVGRARTSGADAITGHLEMVRDRTAPAAVPPSEQPALQMWPGFGSGVALVTRDVLDAAGGFDRRIDGGFGEDTELGVRLRLAGAMVALASDPTFLHLKAPVGGMRAPYPHPWRWDRHRPRPSPTILFARSTFETPAMARGYRLHWWLDGLRQDRWGYRPRHRLRQWRSAQRWAHRLADSEQADLARAVPPRDPDSRPLPPAAPASTSTEDRPDPGT